MKISVITAAYSARDTIADAIESALGQSHADIELIVIDGGSTDGTVEILNCYKERLAVYISEPDEGIYDALNKGIAHATGDIVGFLHADDLFADKHVLSKIAEAFSDSSVNVVYGDLVYVSKGEAGRVIRYWKAGKFSPEKLKAGWMPPHPTLYVRRSVYERLGGFDTSFHIAADYDFMLRLFTQEQFKFSYLPEVLVKMRVGGASNRSLKNILCKSCEDYRALKKNGVGGIFTLAWKSLSKLPQFFRR